ncbi:Type I restriction-modification system methyltransferase subunit [Aerococcus viridans]|uniref:site-specific DNA-methyltransferase (adenine-specific) n=2 Tax=Aerococcus viridans TaxID=1377 RepID=A0AAU8U2A8_9LACT|nr:hypothetical protein AWM76_00825 [Aerococcus viridans]EFG49900.1 hypothetical protein HMPREF0061_0753 [Aerococcus viridans ATCC 11563 = CCUG 4311]SUU10220.1 Type I restriction-modification system methyltransferase subunit [Aerococcus viridans]
MKKNRDSRDVLFIDASNEFTKAKNQNKLEEKHLDKIYETYLKREDVEKYAHVATYEEIEENDFNLNIPRYVDTFEEAEPIDVVALKDEMKQTDQEIEDVSKELLAMVDDLEVTADTKDIIDALKEVLG